MTNAIKAVLIDDEERSRQTLRSLLNRHCPEIHVTGEAASVEEALQLLSTQTPDVVFLDIRLPDGTGCDLLEQLPDRNFDVIFTTAYDEYSLKAFHYAALHYLLKPISHVQLREAVSRLHSSEKISSSETETKNDDRFRVMREQLQEQRKNIVLSSVEGFTIVQIDSIVRCEADSNYTKVIFSNGKTFLASRNLSHFEELLDGLPFVRVHHKHLVNLAYVRRYIKGRGGYVEMPDGKQLEVSVRKKEEFLARMGAFARGVD